MNDQEISAEMNDQGNAQMREKELEAFKVFVDLYKHHFDLWLRGYLVYLAIIGVGAGFLFGDTDQQSKFFVILFLITICLMATLGSSIGYVWIKRLESTVQDLAISAQVPTISFLGFKAVVLLGVLGSVVLTVSLAILWCASIV